MVKSSYAEGTQVSITRSREELERTLERFGAGQQMWMRDDEKAQVVLAFKRKGKTYRFHMKLTAPEQFRLYTKRLKYGSSQTYERSESTTQALADAENRRRFRSLANFVKALMDELKDAPNELAVKQVFRRERDKLKPVVTVPPEPKYDEAAIMLDHLEAAE